jgi:hypothetical protein
MVRQMNGAQQLPRPQLEPCLPQQMRVFGLVVVMPQSVFVVQHSVAVEHAEPVMVQAAPPALPPAVDPPAAPPALPPAVPPAAPPAERLPLPLLPSLLPPRPRRRLPRVHRRRRRWPSTRGPDTRALRRRRGS